MTYDALTEVDELFRSVPLRSAHGDSFMTALTLGSCHLTIILKIALLCEISCTFEEEDAEDEGGERSSGACLPECRLRNMVNTRPEHTPHWWPPLGVSGS